MSETSAGSAAAAIKVCKDCRWCERARKGESWDEFEYARCVAPANSTEIPDLVRGGTQRRNKSGIEFCSTHRAYDQPNLCGAAGNWWEPRQ